MNEIENIIERPPYYTLEGISSRIKTNSVGYWSDLRLFFYLFIIALFCDTLSTVYFMVDLGVHAEFHPAVRFASILFGPYIGPFVGGFCKAVGCLFLTMFFRKYAKWIYLTAAAIYLWAAWYNIWGIHHY